MKSLLAAAILIFLYQSAFAKQYTFSVSPKDTSGGYVSKTVWLERDAMPSVKVSSYNYSGPIAAPKGAPTGGNWTVKLGVERKRPFAVISLPAFEFQAGIGYKMLTGFTAEVEEAPIAPEVTSRAMAKVTSSPTALASGTWYKIAVPARGVYTMSYSFFQSLGVDMGTINPANIRLFGNGGAMISENNAVAHPLDLRENALWVRDGGDGAFNDGDWVAFYAPGPMRWDKDSAGQRFIHAKNLYADSAYYFISFDSGPGLRIQDAPDAGAGAVVTSFDDYAVHETDLYNPGAFGKEWWGEKFGLSADALPARDFSFPLNSTLSGPVRVRMSAASRSLVQGANMTVNVNNNLFTSYRFSALEAYADDKPTADAASTDATVMVSNASSADFHLAYSSGVSDATGFLNFIELNWRRELSFPTTDHVHQDVFTFRDWRSVGPGAVAEYHIGGAQAGTIVWDVTDPTRPQRMNGSLYSSGGSVSYYHFTQKADVLHEFVALPGTDFFAVPQSPIKIGKVENQNLHGADAPQLVIVTHPDFLSAANRLAEYHRQHDAMRVLVATTTQVYNEFSSGGQDISAIRDMMRYYYLQAGTDTSRMPRYLLLFGDASYDYKARLSKNSNFVPTYESPDAIDPDGSFTVDDFFGFLDNSEDINDFSRINSLDVGIGRIPVTTATDAEAAVNKIIGYTSAASLGPWRLSNTYLADNDDGAGLHLEEAENVATAVDERSPFSNNSKIYLESFPEVSTPAGARVPEMNKAINDQIFKGTFLINYTGHGSTTTLAHERVLTASDFSTWKNTYRLPFMVTATCDYARYDNPGYVSNGEQMILKSNGGTIAMLTTTGPVYSFANAWINADFLQAQYTKQAGVWPTFGDAIRNGKNYSFRNHPGSQINFYRFTLLGDPALQPAFPKGVVHSDTVRDAVTGMATDSLRALGTYSVSGHVSDEAGNLLSHFNGRAYITIYDKPRLVTAVTRSKEINSRLCSWHVRDNVIFKGITTVTNGLFSCAFIAPKDMGYDFGKARISYYAENGETDAAGMDTTITAGGFYDGAGTDNDAPVVKPYIGDTLFRDGGITGANTQLYVALSDRSGINASGNGVGHDITAILDGDQMHPYILNDYYQTEPNTYQRGHVTFPITGLANGAHTFTVKAWDVYNNSGEGTVHFVVGDGAVLQLQSLVNYPNPFRDQTHFFFEHNHPGEMLKVQIMVYNTSGQRVRLIEQTFTPGGSHSNEIIWDGTSDAGAQLQSGVYPYRMILTTDKGIQATAYQKLVITR